LLAHRLDDDVHVRMTLLGMQGHGVAVLKGEFSLLRIPVLP
jgi:hypothetical protein